MAQVESSPPEHREEIKEIEPPNAPRREDAIALVKSFPFWYHRIYLGHGVYTMDGGPAYHESVWERAKLAFPSDLKGASVLDVGCNAGYFSIQLKLRGAGQVVGIESWEDFYNQAELCRHIWNLDIEYRHTDAHQIDVIQQKFDLVVFAAILYHLKNPLYVLEQIGRVCEDAILVESEILPEAPGNCVYVRQGPFGQIAVTPCHRGMMKFIEAEELNGDVTNWWVPDTECVMGMLRTAGFKYFSAPIYMAETRVLLLASKKSHSILDLQALQ